MFDITVVIPTYNASKTISDTLSSVLSQRGVSAQVIVVDDGSIDDTVDVVKRYLPAQNVHTIPNHGCSYARNVGLEAATAEIVTFLDADDFYEGSYLVNAVAKIRAQELEFVFGDYSKRGVNVEEDWDFPEFGPYLEIVRHLCTRYTTAVGGVFWRTSFVREIGGWDSSLRFNGDHDMLYRTLSKTRKVGNFKGGRLVVREHDSSNRISNNVRLPEIADLVEVSLRMDRYLRGCGLPDAEVKAIVRSRLYMSVRLAAQVGSADGSDHAWSAYRDYGGRGHEGSFPHKAAVALLGLRKKEQVAMLLARVLSR